MIHLTERGIRDQYEFDYSASLANQPWRKLCRVISTEDPNGETTVRTAGLRGMEERSGMPNFAQSIPTAPFKWFTRRFTDGFQITEDEWNYKKVDEVSAKIAQLAALAAAHPWILLETQAAAMLDDVGVQAIKDPFFPALPFIGATHQVNKPGSQLGTTSNYFTKDSVAGLQWASTTPTEAEWLATLFGVAAAIRATKGDNDIHLYSTVSEFLVLLPSPRWASFAIMMSKLVNAAGTNPLNTAGAPIRFSYEMLPSSSSTTQLLFVPVGKEPFAMQILQKPDRSNMTILGPESEHFKKEKYAPVWIEGRYNVTHMAWEGIFGALIDLTP